jgi:hypothetical protein
VHEELPADDHLPAPHATHVALDVALVAEEDVPAEQLVHDEAPSPEYVPGPQFEHEVLAAAEYVPALHVLQ